MDVVVSRIRLRSADSAPTSSPGVERRGLGQPLREPEVTENAGGNAQFFAREGKFGEDG